jgi:hypothetical protein
VLAAAAALLGSCVTPGSAAAGRLFEAAAARDRDPRERATPLAWAARTGNLEACLYFLSLGAEVNAADRSGDLAAAGGYTRLAALLKERS